MNMNMMYIVQQVREALQISPDTLSATVGRCSGKNSGCIYVQFMKETNNVSLKQVMYVLSNDFFIEDQIDHRGNKYVIVDICFRNMKYIEVILALT